MVERTLLSAIAILAVMKAGAAYLPIDPGNPEDRIRFIIQDSGTGLVLDTREEVGDAGIEGVKHIWLVEFFKHEMKPQTHGAKISQISQISSERGQAGNPFNLAYIIYTSGSTGLPKGVAVEHAGVMNILEGLFRRVYTGYGDPMRVLMVAPFVFDASVVHLFCPLLWGHTTTILPAAVRLDSVSVLKFVDRYGPDIMDGSPTYLAMMLEAMSVYPPQRYVKEMLVAGERLPRDLVLRFRNHIGPDAPLISNLYGPTECSVGASSYILGEPGKPCHMNDIPL
jgi:non-ribosomal peptide synthetase component F